jgi:hypothetical protein
MHRARALALAALICAASTLALARAGSAATAPVQGNPYTSLFPPNVGVLLLCDQFELTVEVWNAPETTAFQFHLGFDPAVLDFRAAAVGTFLSSTGRDVTVLPPVLNGGDLLFAAAAEPGDGPPPSGDGELARVSFEAIAGGVSALDLHDAILINELGQTLPVTSTDSTVTVEPIQGSSCFPTDTTPPTPTATPSATPSPTASSTGSAAPTTAVPSGTDTGTPTRTQTPTASTTAATATPSPTTPVPTPTGDTATPSTTPSDGVTATPSETATGETTPTASGSPPVETQTPATPDGGSFRIFFPSASVPVRPE